MLIPFQNIVNKYAPDLTAKEQMHMMSYIDPNICIKYDKESSKFYVDTRIRKILDMSMHQYQIDLKNYKFLEDTPEKAIDTFWCNICAEKYDDNGNTYKNSTQGVIYLGEGGRPCFYARAIWDFTSYVNPYGTWFDPLCGFCILNSPDDDLMGLTDCCYRSDAKGWQIKNCN
jgi:hypothetical protein